ncbi:hypothetical protein ACFLUG_03245 [Chloroflexota bacterium]
MGKNIYLKGSLTSLAKNIDAIKVRGKTMGECLSELVTELPKLKDKLFYNEADGEVLAVNGILRPHVEIRINGQRANQGGLVQKVRSRDKIEIRMNYQ